MVTVNTVVLVQARFGLTEEATAVALAAFGAGSVLAALVLPRLLEAIPARTAMLAGAGLVAGGLLGGIVLPGYGVLLPLWFALGLGCTLGQTPAGRLLRRSAAREDRQYLYAAQFALAHGCLLITYPLAGWLGASAGLKVDFAVLGMIAVGRGSGGRTPLAAFRPRGGPERRWRWRQGDVATRRSGLTAATVPSPLRASATAAKSF